MRTSLQAGPSSVSSALSRIWACLILRTSALPRASSRSSSSRSAGVSVTRYFLVMAGLLAAASPLTKKRSTHHLSPDKALDDFPKGEGGLRLRGPSAYGVHNLRLLLQNP